MKWYEDDYDLICFGEWYELVNKKTGSTELVMGKEVVEKLKDHPEMIETKMIESKKALKKSLWPSKFTSNNKWQKKRLNSKIKQ